MTRPAEQVHPHRFLSPIPQLGEPLQVPRQGGRVAGDVDHTAGRHGADGVDDVGRQPLPRRVHAHHVRADAPLFQVGGGFAGVGADKFHVAHAVLLGVGPGVLDGRRHDLRADDLFRPLCHHQTDGARAAVQVHHRLVARQSGELQGTVVQHLRLVSVDLEEGGDGQLEGQAAQTILQGVVPPQHPIVPSQDDVGLAGVDVQDHPHRFGTGGRQRLDQLLLKGQRLGVGHHADEGLPLPIGADEHVADEPLAGALVIGGDGVFVHPLAHHPTGLVRDVRLEQTAAHVDDLMAAAAVEAHLHPGLVVLTHRERRLVPVALGLLGPVHLADGQVQPTDALKGVVDALTLQE